MPGPYGPVCKPSCSFSFSQIVYREICMFDYADAAMFFF
jgi:hypothetical protein